MSPEVSVNGTNSLTSINNISVNNMSINNTSINNMSVNNMSVSVNGTNVSKPKKKYNNIMAELLKPPLKEEKPNIHLSGGGQFSKLDKI
jgi:hypothetical protein